MPTGLKRWIHRPEYEIQTNKGVTPVEDLPPEKVSKQICMRSPWNWVFHVLMVRRNKRAGVQAEHGSWREGWVSEH